MKSTRLVAILVLSSTVYKLSQCVTSVTEAPSLTMVTGSTQEQRASRGNPIKKMSEPYQPLTSELQYITFGYRAQMKEAQFESDVSKIVLFLRKLLKYGVPRSKRQSGLEH